MGNRKSPGLFDEIEEWRAAANPYTKPPGLGIEQTAVCYSTSHYDCVT